MISPARRAAYRILADSAPHGGDLPGALAHSRATLTDPRDQALAAEIALGTLRWQAALDHLIAVYARRRVESLDPEVLIVLRSAAYQLLHLQRVPVSAAVNDAVALVREVRKASAAGFVNAVLRAIDRHRAALPLPARPASVEPESSKAWLDYLAISLSHPRWLVARWVARYGPEATERWLQFNNQEAALSLRANRLRTDRDALAERLASRGVTTRPASRAPDGLLVVGGNPLRRSPGRSGQTSDTADKAGLFVVQDEASQLVGLMAPVESGARVLDACASPGGKTTQLAAAMSDRGVVVACDVRSRRVALLRQTVEGFGARCVRCVQADFAAGAPFGPAFDVVLLDAPCSGLGTLRRDPDIKWRRAEDDLVRLADTQFRMLDHASGAVRPGGHLLYATCSSEPEEDEDVVGRFLDKHAEFEPARPGPLVAHGLSAVVDERGHLRTYPHVHDLEAFFGALMRRRA